MKEISFCSSIQSISITKSKSNVKTTKKQTQSHFRFSFSMPIINSRPSFDEGMIYGSPIFAYLVFDPGGVPVERIARPMKIAAWRGP
jgi:hypothetical protein